MKLYLIKKLALVSTATVMAAWGANAQIIFTASGTSDSNPVDAEATFTFNDTAHTLTIVLQNLEPGAPTTFSGQAISGLTFQGLSGSTTVVDATGQLITINADGSYSFGSDADNDLSHWDASGSSGLTTLSGQKPNEMIIGAPPYYPNGNGNGFSGFDPYVYETATFVLSNADINAQTSISNVRFDFGTPDGNLPGSPSPAPEASTLIAGALMLLPLGIGAVRALRRERPANL